jgi:hypothetical protein
MPATDSGKIVVPGTGLYSHMNKGFAWVWGIIFVPHKKFHFGVSRAQQLRSGKAGQIGPASLFLTAVIKNQR